MYLELMSRKLIENLTSCQVDGSVTVNIIRKGVFIEGKISILFVSTDFFTSLFFTYIRSVIFRDLRR